MNSSGYDVTMSETHHIHKLDAPSGTAITLAEGILENMDRKDKWVKGTLLAPDGTALMPALPNRVSYRLDPWKERFSASIPSATSQKYTALPSRTMPNNRAASIWSHPRRRIHGPNMNKDLGMSVSHIL